MMKSMIDIAYEWLVQQSKEADFADLWNVVTKELEFTPEEAERRVGLFYSYLTLDGRFVTVGENRWDLRKNLTFDKVHIDMNDIYAEEEEKEKEYLEEADESEDIEVVDDEDSGDAVVVKGEPEEDE